MTKMRNGRLRQALTLAMEKAVPTASDRRTLDDHRSSSGVPNTQRRASWYV